MFTANFYKEIVMTMNNGPFGMGTAGLGINAMANLGDRDGIVSQLNSLLRGEISAAETYKQAIDKVTDSAHQADAQTLRSIQQEHGRAAQAIRQRIRELGGEAVDSSGAWGVWAKTVAGTLSLFGGDSGALKALKEGEEHGLKDYRDALDTVDGTSAQIISSQLLPAQEKHIVHLDGMIKSIK
jgi:uncharacterized protein (TIGR02284 family)